jgi:hypothetical protein
MQDQRVQAHGEPCAHKVMTMNAQTTKQTGDDTDDDMPAEIDFSKGVRGKFYNPNAVFQLPIYLDAPIAAYLTERARAKGVEYSQLVNELLRKDIELIEAAR